MQEVARLMFRIVYDLAERETLPAYRPAARYELTRRQQHEFEEEHKPAPPRLGASWQPIEGEEGMRVTQITDNSAAQQAGLRIGDKIIRFWRRKPTAAMPLSVLVWGAPQQTEMEIERKGEGAKTLAVNLPGNSMRVGLAWKDHEAEPSVVTLVLVVPGTPGDIAGLQVKDRVMEVNGKRFAASEDLLGLLYKEPSPLNLLIERAGRLQMVKIVRPEELPAPPGP
jgi:C-terminal processing protease CtpA/Prc